MAKAQDAFDEIPPELLLSRQIGCTITARPTVIENERFVVNIPGGVYVPDSLEADIHLLMDTIEQQTGLSFYSDYAQEQGCGKVRLEVGLSDAGEFGNTSGGAYGADISAGDLIFKHVMDMALVHELTHTIHWRNCSGGTPSLYEAFSTYMTQRIIERQVFLLFFDS